jgi:hypothetical protein
LAEVLTLDASSITYRIEGGKVRRDRAHFMKLWDTQTIRLGTTNESNAQRRERLIKIHKPLIGAAIADAIARRGELAHNVKVYSPDHAHHVIPVSLLERVHRLRMLVATGWDFNQEINGVALGANIHGGSHRSYTQYVLVQVTAWEAAHGESPVSGLHVFHPKNRSDPG